jgi:hypothetical protein
MNKEIAKQWCAALRSGKYKQGQYSLYNVSSDTYCCLGVLCELYIEGGGHLSLSLHDNGTTRAYDGCTGLPPSKVIDWAGIFTLNGVYNTPDDNLVANNDSGLSFDWIANIIEAQVEYL